MQWANQGTGNPCVPLDFSTQDIVAGYDWTSQNFTCRTTSPGTDYLGAGREGSSQSLALMQDTQPRHDGDDAVACASSGRLELVHESS